MQMYKITNNFDDEQAFNANLLNTRNRPTGGAVRKSGSWLTEIRSVTRSFARRRRRRSSMTAAAVATFRTIYLLMHVSTREKRESQLSTQIDRNGQAKHGSHAGVVASAGGVGTSTAHYCCCCDCLHYCRSLCTHRHVRTWRRRIRWLRLRFD